MSKRNTWTDERIIGHPFVDADDESVRRAAENIHANESLHRHDPSGAVCVYCAIVASRAGRVMRAEARKEHADGMRWTCEQAGHPKQLPDDVMCICETWGRHVEAGAVVVDCAPSTVETT